MTPALRSITVRRLIQALDKDGWSWTRTSGSHRIYVKGDRTVVVPYHRPGDTFTPKTLASVLDATGWTDEDLHRLRLLK